MGIWDSYVDMVREVSDAKAGRMPSGLLNARQQQSQNMLDQAYGQNVNVQGQMASNEFDEQGRAINPRSSTSERTYSTGLLGNPNDPQAAAAYRDVASRAGLKTEDVNQRIADARRVGGFKDSASQLTAYNTLRDKHEKLVTKPRAVLETYGQASDLVKQRGSFDNMTAQDDLALISSFAQMQRPGEAMNESDVTNILQAAGVWEMVKGMWETQGAKALSPTTRRKIYDTMSSMAKTNEKRYNEVRDQTQKAFDIGGFGQNVDTPMRPGMEVNPFQGGLPPGAPKGSYWNGNMLMWKRPDGTFRQLVKS